MRGEKAVADGFLSVIHPGRRVQRNGEAGLLFVGSVIILI